MAVLLAAAVCITGLLAPATFVNCNIEGPLVPELGGLKNLRYLELFENDLNGSIPTTLGNLSNLQGNLLAGTIPASLGTLSSLKNLRLSGNKLTGAIPSSLGNLTNLVILEIQKNAPSGSIPASLGNIKTLRFLRLNQNMLTGTVPVEILSLVSVGKLIEINVDNNNLTGTVRSGGSRLTNEHAIYTTGRLSFWLSLAFVALF